jgi:hypothetical protein
MNSVKNYMLDKALTWILGGDLFLRIKKIVEGLLDVNIPGSEKRNIAIRDAKLLGADIANFILNLGIEAAVYLLKEKQAKR